MDCGGRVWFKKRRFWHNPNDCYAICTQCIMEAIKADANDVECEQTVVLAQCWMGYH
jgi:hypothetical protein